MIKKIIDKLAAYCGITESVAGLVVDAAPWYEDEVDSQKIMSAMAAKWHPRCITCGNAEQYSDKEITCNDKNFGRHRFFQYNDDYCSSHTDFWDRKGRRIL